jgi:ATP-binding cassette subfamily B protein
VNKIDLLANIKQAAEFAGLANVIDGLPMGYDTPLSREFDNEGVELSKGQKSKIAIARAFMSDGQILLFDEPTASLDARAENDYFESLKKLIRNKTCLIITHRLTSIKSVDRILVLSNGEIVEDGNHEALMRNKGFYFQLYETQSEKYMKLAKEGKNEKNYTI